MSTMFKWYWKCTEKTRSRNAHHVEKWRNFTQNMQRGIAKAVKNGAEVIFPSKRYLAHLSIEIISLKASINLDVVWHFNGS